jgi:GntR family transcriptional repressor for pyruvate dehydrogenase complex
LVALAQVTAESERRETIMETVARRIEGLIRTGELRSGSLLPPEPELASMLGIGRSSLREALKGLMFLGLIKARPGYGTYIQSSLGQVISRHFQWMLLLQEIKYLELYEVRRILEPTVASLAARRATPEDIDEMETAVRGMKENFHRPEQYLACDMLFHEVFARAAKNVAMQTLLSMMHDALADGRRRVLPLIDNFENNQRVHERIYRAIARRDPKAARKAVLDDLKYSEGLLRRDIESQNGSPGKIKWHPLVINSKSKRAGKTSRSRRRATVR